MSSTAPMMSFFSALSVLSYSLNISWDSSCARRMEEVCEAVAAEGILAMAPGLGEEKREWPIG